MPRHDPKLVHVSGGLPTCAVGANRVQVVKQPHGPMQFLATKDSRVSWFG